MEELCQTRVLADEPADDDAFGSHQRVANAIAELVRGEPGGKALALTGEWGGGKSTVIHLLRNQLSREGDDEPAVFVFDAWAHRGDPLRRSFLEALIKCLTDRGWVDESSWQPDLENLAHRREESEVQTTPILTRRGRWLAVSLLASPLGYALFSSFIASTRVHKALLGLPIWAWGLLLVALPLLVAFGAMVLPGADGKKAELLAIFLKKSEERTRTTTLRSPEPTSLEFAEMFNRLVTDALSEEGHRLVVVIDNLDRVEVEDALSIWATMMTFFDLPGQRMSTPWIKQLWLIVPFAHSSVRRLWGESGTTTSSNVEAEDEDSAGETSIRPPSNVAEAFLDKTFQVRFRVSPPVLSDWKDFFHSQLHLAFPDHEADEFDAVYRIFRRSGLSDDRPLTPRDIKLFINKVGALHRQWHDEIPLAAQALSVVLEPRLAGIGRELTAPDTIPPKLAALAGEHELLRNLAAIHFNVNRDKALQVLISKRIEKAIANDDVDEMRELVRVPGFEVVCEELIEESQSDWAQSDPALLTSAARLIAQIEGEVELPWAAIWRHLKDGVRSVERWRPLDDKTAEGLALVLNHCSDADYESVAKRVITAVGASLVSGADQEEAQ